MTTEDNTVAEETSTVSAEVQLEGDSSGAPEDATNDTRPATEAPPLLQPIEWGRQLGKVKKATLWFGDGPRGETKSPDYLHAEYLHGWIEAELRGRPKDAKKLLITRETFDAALKAAMTADEKTGAYTPHHAALAAHLRGDK